MPPITVMIKPVSGACNMRCRYCFYADEMKRREVAISPRMSDALLDVTASPFLSGSFSLSKNTTRAPFA